MNQGEFYSIFKKLCEYYNSDIFTNQKITVMYYEKVKDLSKKEFAEMCIVFINSSKFMPRVSEFNENDGNGHYGRHYSNEYLENLYDIGGN